jgi:hypothetical protein
MKHSCLTRQAGSQAGPVLPFFLCLLFLTSFVVLAQKGKRTQVTDSILGVGIGASLEQAHAKLDRLSTRRARGARGEEAREDEEAGEREGGRKEAWTLESTEYASVALQADRQGRVVWITGFVRPGKEIPFAKLGNPSSAAGLTDSRAIWNVATPDGGYRLVAKGQNRKARVVYLLSLATTPVQ